MRYNNIFFPVKFNFDSAVLQIYSLITLSWLKRNIFWFIRSVLPRFGRGCVDQHGNSTCLRHAPIHRFHRASDSHLELCLADLMIPAHTGCTDANAGADLMVRSFSRMSGRAADSGNARCWCGPWTGTRRCCGACSAATAFRALWIGASRWRIIRWPSSPVTRCVWWRTTGPRRIGLAP